MTSEGPADVPSPIDFHTPAEAKAWADTAMTKRPWRTTFFSKLVAELEPLRMTGGRILELGSGPGFLAQAILEALPNVEYAALDFSAAMHELAKERLGPRSRHVQFLEADFKMGEWNRGLPRFHAVVTLQAVHELRHKRHAVAFYRRVRDVLLPQGPFLVCDHVCGESGTSTNEALYMTLQEHEDALREGGFSVVGKVHHQDGMVLYRAHAEAP